MNEQKTVRAARADKQITKKRRTNDEQMTNNERTNDEGRVVLKQREVKAKRELKKRILVDFNFGKVCSDGKTKVRRTMSGSTVGLQWLYND